MLLLEFTISPQVGPRMPLVIRENGSQTLSCRHNAIGIHATQWYHETSAIRRDVPEGAEGCSCESTASPSSITLTFTDFAARSAGGYSCRVPDPFNDPAQNICRFDVLVGGE